MFVRPHIVLATPCFGGMVTSAYMQSVVGLIHAASVHGIDISLALLGQDALITRCRNTLLGAFMESPASHIMFIDSDILFEPESVVRLIQSGKDFVAGMYPIKALNWDLAPWNRKTFHEDEASSCLMYVGQPEDAAQRREEGGFVSAVYAGTGFMLVSRHAVARMIAAHPELKYRAIHAWPLPAGTERERYALFDTMIHPQTGEYLSEDYAFCHRWRALGGYIWIDTMCNLTHIGSNEYRGNPAGRFAAAA